MKPIAYKLARAEEIGINSFGDISLDREVFPLSEVRESLELRKSPYLGDTLADLKLERKYFQEKLDDYHKKRN
jgi:hypothetical protein